MPWLLGAIGVLLLLALAVRGFLVATPAQLRKAGAAILATVGGGLILLLVLSGRVAQALPLLLTFAPMGLGVWRRWRNARRFGASPGASSEVETATLLMRLDHATGLLSGRVRRGPLAGRELGELQLGEILALHADCRAIDLESLPLLESWLDHAHPAWRGMGSADDGPLDTASALKLLGLGEGASESEIRAAHRRLMRGAHPDQGGSAEYASRLNAARDTLLARKTRQG
ncbi:J domain-containing protein [Pseudoroseomonas globiformis]|uniref:J domain-containing protein n=1 Tax=Teichococcus globiformis TaxID=2307229 RepID=A0ABV7FUS3_9PROT